MVKPTDPPRKKKILKPSWRQFLLPITIIVTILYFGLPPFLDLDEKGNYVLSKDRLKDYFLKPQKSESVEVYQLVALEDGFYPCLNCSGMQTIYLEAGQIWKYGISRNGKNRYPQEFYITNKLQYIRLMTTDILNAEQMERQLIIAYPLLPECQKRMKLKQIFLKRPPGNAKDQ